MAKRVRLPGFGNFPEEMKEMKASRKLLALSKTIKVNFRWQRGTYLEIVKMVLEERKLSTN